MNTTERSLASSQPFNRRWRAVAWEWLAMVCVAGLLTYVGRIVPSGLLRAVVTLPVLLVIPGLALASLLVGRLRLRDSALFGVFCLILSFTVLMFDALVLNAAHVRFSGNSLGFAALGSTAILIALNIVFGREFDSPIHLPMWASRSEGGASAARVLAIVFSIAIVFGGVAVASTHLAKPKSQPYSSLSLGSSWARKANAPVVRTGEVLNIPIVASNHSGSGEHYDLSTSVDGVLFNQRTVYIASDGTWHGATSVTAPAGKTALHRVLISLSSTTSSSQPEQVIVYLKNNGS